MEMGVYIILLSFAQNLAGNDPESHRPDWIEVKRMDGEFINPMMVNRDMHINKFVFNEKVST